MKKLILDAGLYEETYVPESEYLILQQILAAIEQRSADNMDDRATVHAVHKLASDALRGI